jgi:hypothetical protein
MNAYRPVCLRSGVGLDRALAIEQVENSVNGVELFLPVVVDSALGSAPGAFAIPAEDDSAAYSERVVGFEVAVLWAARSTAEGAVHGLGVVGSRQN